MNLKLFSVLVVSLFLVGCNFLPRPKPGVNGLTLSEKVCVAFGGVKKIKKYSYHYLYWDMGGLGTPITNYESIEVVCNNGQTVELENHIQ